MLGSYEGRRVFFDVIKNRSWTGPVRTLISQREARREQLFVEHRSRELGFKSLIVAELLEKASKPIADTMFILGSGSSIERLTVQQFEHIRSGISVGVNAWVLHDFIPDIYAYEPVPDDRTDHYHTLGLLNRREVVEEKPLILVLRPRTPVEDGQMAQIPKELISRTFLYGRVAPVTRNVDVLSSDLANLVTAFSKLRAEAVTLDSGASIVRMASIAVRLRIPRVVFVGVDLNTTEYFWHANPAHLERHGLSNFESGQTGLVHETLSSATRAFAVTDMLRAMGTVHSALNGGEFFVASASSRLASQMALYTWGN